MPSFDELNELGHHLHSQLLSGDLLASSRIADLFLPLISRGLHHKFHSIPDQSLVDAAAADALMQYFTRPEKFDPKRGKLFGYLWMSAQGDLLNLLDRDRKLAKRHVDEKVVEFESPSAEEYLGRSIDPEETLLRSEQAALINDRVRQIIEDETDLKLVDLMLDGVRETISYAEVLSITDRPEQEQSMTVKRAKDRIKVALRRGLRERKVWKWKP
jgi:hypothetical protein